LHKKAVRIVKKKVLKKATKEYRKAKLEAKKNGLPPPEPPSSKRKRCSTRRR
jgi:hypothetical protein